MNMRLILTTTAVIVFLISVLSPAPAGASPILLSFDVEESADVPALKKLDISVPSTWFVTGEFARRYPEAVRSLASEGNTIGSHSDTHRHFRSLEPESIRLEVTASKKILESVTGKAVTWFRAPYLEYDDRLLQALKSAGYQGDSSEKESWASQATILELPISNFINSSLIASDYDMIEEAHFDDQRFEGNLRKMYLEKVESGQPFVVLLHPRIAVKKVGALKKFIAWAGKHDGQFMSFNGYITSIREPRPLRRAVWIELNRTTPDPGTLLAQLSATGTTDVFIAASDTLGNRYYGEGDTGDRFGKTVSILRSKGIRVHAVLSVLANAATVGLHPDWAMHSKSGDPSDLWLSPSNPDVVDWLGGMVRELVRNYRLDGICLDKLALPSSEFDYSPRVISTYASDARFDRTPSFSELMNSDYTSWCTWKSQQIADLAGALKKSAEGERGKNIEISTIVPASTAINYREPESSGQNVEMLGRKVDLLVADLPWPGTPEELEAISLKLVALRVQAGNRPILFRLPQPAGSESANQNTFSDPVVAVSQGIDGIGFAPGPKERGQQ